MHLFLSYDLLNKLLDTYVFDSLTKFQHSNPIYMEKTVATTKWVSLQSVTYVTYISDKIMILQIKFEDNT